MGANLLASSRSTALGIECQKALDQFLRTGKPVADYAKEQYGLGALSRQTGKKREAIKESERTTRLNLSLAAPRYQLYPFRRRANVPASHAGVRNIGGSGAVTWPFRPSPDLLPA